MDDLPFAPSQAAPDEVASSAGPAFAVCEEALKALVAHGGWSITSRQYWVSPQWGNVLRARVMLGPGMSSDVPVICSAKPGEGAQIVLDMYDPTLADRIARTHR